jgi:hypothetical protein
MKSKYDSKFMVEDVYTLNIRELQDLGLFYKHLGEITEIITPPSGQNAMRLSVWGRTTVDWTGIIYIDVTFPRSKNNVPVIDEFNYTISTFPVKCARGGERLYINCPIVMENGNQCDKAASILYLPPGEKMLGCRDCHKLTYDSTRKRKDSKTSIFSIPGADWILEFDSDFQRFKKQYGIRNGEPLSMQSATSSVTPQRVFGSESEKLNYSFAQTIGMSDEEYDEMNRRAEINAQLVEKDWEYLDKYSPKKK